MTATSSNVYVPQYVEAPHPLTSAASWVRQLAPRKSSTIQHSCFEDTWADAVERLGGAPALWVVEICGELAELSANLDQLVGPRRSEAVNALRPTCEAVVLGALIALDSGQPVPVTVPRETLEQLRAAVRQRVPLARILDSQHLAHQKFSDALVDEFSERVAPEDQPQRLSALSHFLVDHVSSFAAACTAAYISEERAWLAGTEGSRAELVRSLLRGDPVPGDVSRALRYELNGRSHVALVLRRDPRTSAPDAVPVDRVAASLLTTMGCFSQLVIAPGIDEVWCWGSIAEKAVRSADTLPRSPGVLVAIGSLAAGAEGFRQTHEDAQEALRVAELAATDAIREGIFSFDSLQLAALLTAEPRRAARFALDTLGPLGRPGESSLRETLSAYLACHGSPATAAAKLGVAKNTVSYRIKRAEELLGRNIRDHQQELSIALYLTERVDIARFAESA